MKSKGKIALGLSGGVDSAVAAALLADAGFDVVGVTLQFQDDARAHAAQTDAARVAAALGIEHHVYDCAQAFKARVVKPFVDAFAQCLTPSPCIECNKVCKFPELLNAAVEYGCDSIATGHYARIVRSQSGKIALRVATDVTKDQSYMLALLDQDILGRLELPLGGFSKTQVRDMAGQYGIPVADKQDSQDICFAEDGYRALLKEWGYIDKPGDVINTEGRQVGRHTGLSDYTIGQRKGLGIAAPQPYYVIGKSSETNTLTVGFKDETFITCVECTDCTWTEYEPTSVKLRYRTKAAACTVERAGSGCVVALAEPHEITAPGQYAVFYNGDIVAGAAKIAKVES